MLRGCDQFCMAMLEIEHSEPLNLETAAGLQGGGWRALENAGRQEEEMFLSGNQT